MSEQSNSTSGNNKDLPVRFHLPGLRQNYPLNMFWISLLKTHPEFFRDNVEIGSVFGCFPVALWNGGRFIAGDQCDRQYIMGVVKALNNAGVPVRYTFTSPLITEEDLDDPYCNFCMQVGDTGMNEVMIFSPILEQYIRDKYPSYKLNSSTCKEIRDKDELNAELEKDYKYVVLDYNLNNHWDIIDGLNKPEKLEVLINCLCLPNCPRRGEHYRNMARDGRIVLENRKLPPDKQKPIEPWYCEYGDHGGIYRIMNYPTFVSAESIWNDYMPRGINNFKIEGRTANLFSLIETYSYFMLKPECSGEARLLLLRNLEESHIIQVNRPRPARFE